MRNSGIIKSINVNLLISFFVLMVLFIHLQAFTTKLGEIFGFGIVNILDIYIRGLAVGGFIFLSGYKLAQSKISEPVISFLKNRFLRITPLYMFAVIFFSLYLYSYNLGVKPSFMNVIIHLFGVQAVFFEQYGVEFPVLYFVGLLYLYYLIFIFVRKFFLRKLIFLFVSCLVFLFLLLLRLSLFRLTGLTFFSNLFFLYYPLFILGMLCEDNVRWLIVKNNVFINYILLIISIVSSFYYVGISSKVVVVWQMFVLKNIFFVLMSVPLYLYFMKINIKLNNKKIINIINKIAYSSFVIYLFNEPIWMIMSINLNKNSLFYFLYIIILGPLVVFIASYYIQSFYDKILIKFTKV